MNHLEKQQVNVNMTLNDYYDYLMYLIRNNTGSGISLEMVMLSMLHELRPEALDRLLEICKTSYPNAGPNYTVGMRVYRVGDDLDTTATHVITKVMEVNGLVELDNDQLVSMDDIIDEMRSYHYQAQKQNH